MSKMVKVYYVTVAGDKACRDFEKYMQDHKKTDMWDITQGVLNWVKMIRTKSVQFYKQEWEQE